ncbi:MAG TPA: PAS domain S-box protein, partial [Burkholderiales bacterium]|nr:PAS domain S-box protein [Burkholderiales bacterium]
MHKPLKLNSDPRLDGTSRDWLQSSEELLRFRAAMEISGDAIYLVDRATMRLIDVNQTACERMGYEREELLQMGPHDLLNAPREQIELEYDAVIAAGAGGVTRESSARAKDGHKSVTELQRRALRWGDGWIIVSIARDVTRRKRAERAARRIGRMYEILGATNEAILRAREPAQLYQRVCDAAVGKAELITAATVFIPDAASGRVDAVAAAGIEQPWIRDVGVSVDESKPQGRGLVGTAYRSLKTSVSNDCLGDARLLAWREDALAQQILAAVAVPLLKDGKVLGVMHFCANEIDAFDEETVQLLDRMGENVSFALENLAREDAHKRAERALRESEQRYRNIYESLQDVYVETAPDGTILDISPQVEVLSGGQYKREELLGKAATAFYGDPQRRKALGLALAASGRVSDFESSFRNRDGTLVPMSISARLLRDADGQPRKVLSTMRDITERKRAEEAMRSAEEQFRGLVEQSIAGIYIIQDGRFAYVNRRYAEIFGYPDTGELIGRDPFMVVSAQDRNAVRETIRLQLEHDSKTVTFSFAGQRKDGSALVAGAHCARATHRGRPAVIGLMQGIS